MPAPEGWRERLELVAGRRKDSVVVAVVVATSVFGGLGLWARGAPPSIAPPARATPSPSGSASASVSLIVHVSGAVRSPGIVELPEGARVTDAIELAGGALPRAELDLLNLAALVADGTQIHVPAEGDLAPAHASPAAGTTTTALIDLNTADQATLETVPGLGPVKAGAILAYRIEIGRFETLDQLLEVTGIGPATLESIRPFISI